ncbi:hypothetical protein HYH02_005213 [Chlamydomonas schloesseri]|uniref:Uncharacterized protein n=1 Tax=Chlamydomonas schloesseri TaxID=2026947 RepID=A0A835WL20_9CHLO|nr:hypothetical protein HYH02_005213 [Chlamydomonas schloesseri]|eukprot:KAG2449684.1 hypothetical protein HYH02_005213 [Chlamydomonas schloesseri]
MDLGPRKRSAAYEHKSVIGNILTPTSGPPGQADYRVTPSSRGAGQGGVSRPPWATELDDASGGFGAAPPGRPGSASRQRPGTAARSGHEDFSFATPPARSAGGFNAGPVGSGGQADQLDLWTQQQAHAQHPHQHAQQPRPGSGSTRPGPDSGGLYGRLDHDTDGYGLAGPGPGAGAGAGAGQPGSLGRRVGSVGTGGSVARLQGGSMSSADASGAQPGSAPAPGGRVAVGAAAGSAPQPAPGAAARASGRPPPSGGAAGAGVGTPTASASGRVGASPARGTTTARAGAGAGTSTSSGGGAAPGSRSTSTPRPRPSLPPKRSTSDSPRRADWVDIADPGPVRAGAGGGGGGGSAPRRPAAGSAARPSGRGGSAGAAEGRWDSGDNDSDRGSWLFVGDPEAAAEVASPAKVAAPAARGGGAKGAAAERRPAVAPAAVNEWDEVPVGGARARQAALEAQAAADVHDTAEPFGVGVGADVSAGPGDRRQHRADQAHSEWDTSLAGQESGGLGGGGAWGRSLDGEDSKGAGTGRGARQAASSGVDWGDEGEERHGGHTGPTSFGRRAAKPHGSLGPSGSAAPASSSGGVAGGLEATFASSPSPAAASFTFGGLASGGLGHGLAAGEAAPRAPSRGGSGGSSAGGAGRATAATASVAESKQLQVLQEENARLREQVEHLQRLAASAGGGGGAGASGPEAGTSGRRAAGPLPQRPHSAMSAAEVQRSPAAALAAANAAGVQLQQYKSQVIQLQRQVALMAREMEAKSRIAAEAEGALLATAERLQELIAATAPSAASDDDAPLSQDHLAQLHKWSKQMLGRLKSEKSQSARLFTRQDLADNIARAAGRGGGAGGGGGGGPGLSPSWGDSSSTGGGGGASGAPAQTWQVPFIPAGGNRFLQAAAAAAAAADDGSGMAAAAAPPPAGPSVAAIASGQAALLADPLLAHRLELQLAAVAPKLAAVAVLLKTQLLPAMPWLSMEASDRLQAETSEAAESVAQAAEGLVLLCSLLPAGAAVFGDAPAAAEAKRRAAQVEAGRDAWLYGSPKGLGAPPEQPMVDEAGQVSVSRVQAALTPLLRDRKAGGRALGGVLEPLRAAAAAGAAKRAVLEAELRFAARAGGLAAEHVSHLMMSVGMALEDVRAAKDAAAIKSYFAAAAAVRQVLAAADSLEAHPCEACLKGLVEQVRAQRDWLDCLPDLLINAPAADVEGQLLSKVEELHQGFKKALGKLDAHKRRTLDAHARRAGGDAGGGNEDAEGGEYADDWQGEGEEGDGGGGGMRVQQQGGARGGGAGTRAAAGRPAGAGPAAAAKPPKPSPPPRQEWQD